jgi:selenophosphate synthase
MDALATVVSQSVRMTEYNHGSGYGYKISPRLLDETLQTDFQAGEFPHLLVGNYSMDDTATFGLGNGSSAISITDFFMPIVDEHLALGCYPGGAQQHFDSYGDKASAMSELQLQLLCDPQTSGGLLIAVREPESEFRATSACHGLQLQSIGSLYEPTGPVQIEVC